MTQATSEAAEFDPSRADKYVTDFDMPGIAVWRATIDELLEILSQEELDRWYLAGDLDDNQAAEYRKRFCN